MDLNKWNSTCGSTTVLAIQYLNLHFLLSSVLTCKNLLNTCHNLGLCCIFTCMKSLNLSHSPMKLVWFLSPFLHMRTEKGSNLPKFTLLVTGRTGIGKGSSYVGHKFIWSLYKYVRGKNRIRVEIFRNAHLLLHTKWSKVM